MGPVPALRENRQEKSWPETSWPVQNLGIALITLAATTTGVPAQPVLDSQIICESFTGTWMGVKQELYISPAMLAASIVFPSVLENSTPSSVTSPRTTADSVKALHAESGLTWDQLARLFGVSRRAVHHWASGGRMNAVNEEQLGDIQDVIRKLSGDSPADRRSMILASPPEGPSIFEQLKSRRPTSEILQASAYSPDLLIG